MFILVFYENSKEMLDVKDENIIDTLIDKLELDGSSHVRILALKALFNLASTNPKVQLSFNNLESTNKQVYM